MNEELRAWALSHGIVWPEDVPLRSLEEVPLHSPPDIPVYWFGCEFPERLHDPDEVWDIRCHRCRIRVELVSSLNRDQVQMQGLHWRPVHPVRVKPVDSSS